MTSNAESQDKDINPPEATLIDTSVTEPTQVLTQPSIDNMTLLEYSSVSLCEQETSQTISLESVEPDISLQEHISTPHVTAAIHSTEPSVAPETTAVIDSTVMESHNEGEQGQALDTSTPVGQEDRIEIFTSGMEDEQEFPNPDAINTKQKAGEQGPSFDTKENGDIEQTLDFSDKENKQRELNKDKPHSTSHRSSRKLDESSRDKNRGISKHIEHHTHKDLREILTKNSFAANKSREFESRKIKKTSRSGLDMSISRDRESTQRHRRMYQEIKNTLSSSSSAVFTSRDIDPEREWEDKKREREMQRIEVERARRELESRRRQESQSSLHSSNGLKRSLSGYTPDSRPLTIEGGHSEYPIPPVVQPLPFEGDPTRIARVQNLVRPFTQQQLKSMLELYGPLVVGTDTPHQYFWTDKNKTQCCCVYQNIISCSKARNALHGARWPSINPKNLSFSFLSIENFNELTGLGITQGVLDNTKHEIIVGIESPPIPTLPQKIERGKEREKVKEKLKVKEKDKKEKDKIKEKDKNKEKEKIKEKEKVKEKEKPKEKIIRDKDKSKDTEQHRESKEVLKKVKKDKPPSNETVEEKNTGPSVEKKQSTQAKKDNTHKPKEITQAKVKVPEPVLSVEIIPKPSKTIEPSVKAKDEKVKVTEEKPKIKQEKPKISEKKTPTKRPAPPSPTAPQCKKPRDSKGVQSESEMESDNYQCSGQAALLDTLFRKTVAEPCIYWLPLTDDQIKAKLKRKQIEKAKSSESQSHKKRKYTPSPKRKRK